MKGSFRAWLGSRGKSLVNHQNGAFNVFAIIFIHKLLRQLARCPLRFPRLKCNLDRFCAGAPDSRLYPAPITVPVQQTSSANANKWISLAMKTTFASDCDLACLVSIKNVLPSVALPMPIAPFCAKITNYWNYWISRWDLFSLGSLQPDFVVSLRTLSLAGA